jgi:hypothetical protein
MKKPAGREFSCSWFRLNMLNLNLNLISKEGRLVNLREAKIGEKVLLKKFYFFNRLLFSVYRLLINNIAYFRAHVASLQKRIKTVFQ